MKIKLSDLKKLIGKELSLGLLKGPNRAEKGGKVQIPIQSKETPSNPLPVALKGNPVSHLPTEEEMEEALVTPDYGTDMYGKTLWYGGSVEPFPGYYDGNTDEVPPAPEEQNPGVSTDPSDSLVAPKRFVPKK